MKILIWIHKSEAISGNIAKHYFTRPYHDRHEDWVQVSISVDEFVYLEDRKIDTRSLLEREHNDDQYSASIDGPGLSIKWQKMARVRKYGARSRSERRMEAEQRNTHWSILQPQQQLEKLDRRLGKVIGAKKQRTRIQYKIDHPQIDIQRNAKKKKRGKNV